MQNGYKTKSRSYIMEFFTAHKEQIVSAADIHHYLEENGKQVNLATIYRNLDKMTDEGILLKYKTAKDEHAVYGRTPGMSRTSAFTVRALWTGDSSGMWIYERYPGTS